MPDTTDLDWNAIEDIDFSFGKLPNPTDADKHVRLNQAFSQHLYYEETESLFITHKDGTKTLGLNPVTILRALIIDEILDCLPSKARTETTKQHIVALFKFSTMWHIAANGSLGCIRNKATLDAAARQAIANHSPVLRLQMQIPHWGFKKDWWPYDFIRVYDTHIYSFPTKSNTRETTTVADKTPSNTTTSVPPVTANLDPLQPVGTIANIPSVTTPRYIWTWTYSPNIQSDSDSIKCATSFGPPVQHHNESPVTAPSVRPSALTRFGHHSVPPSVPANFGWTFHPQNEIATFRRLPKSVPSPQPPSCIRLLPAEVTDLPNAAPAYIPSLQSPCPFSPPTLQTPSGCLEDKDVSLAC
eukprot:jgi/Psemu1/45732/gm1.45732_g